MQAKALIKNFGNKSLELTGRLGNQKHLAVMRDAFALFMPLIIAGALAVLIRTFIFGGAGALQTSILGWISDAKGDVLKAADGSWSLVAGTAADHASHIGNFLFHAISHATIDMMSLYVAFGMGYFLAKVRGSDTPVIAGVLSLGAFIVAVTGVVDLFDAKGLVTAIVISILSSEIFCLLSKNGRLEIKMPAGVPPAVARAFGKLLPAMIILVIVVALNLPFVLFGVLKGVTPQQNLWGDAGTWTLGSAIYAGVQAPFLSFAGSNSGGLSIAFIYVMAVSIMWFFGIHGTNVLFGIFSPIFLALYQDNASHGAHNIFVQGTFDAFIWVGGAGATFGFILTVFLFSRNKAEREIAKIGIGPAIFQINEPVVFGMPLILNPRYIVPFVFTMPILTILTYFGFTWFHIHPVTVLIPWTAPFGAGALLSTAVDWKAFVLAAINFTVAFLMWMPWVMLWSKKELKEEKALKKEKKALKGAKN